LECTHHLAAGAAQTLRFILPKLQGNYGNAPFEAGLISLYFFSLTKQCFPASCGILSLFSLLSFSPFLLPFLSPSPFSFLPNS
jgi:hypothetical protein